MSSWQPRNDPAVESNLLPSHQAEIAPTAEMFLHPAIDRNSAPMNHSGYFTGASQSIHPYKPAAGMYLILRCRYHTESLKVMKTML